MGELFLKRREYTQHITAAPVRTLDTCHLYENSILVFARKHSSLLFVTYIL